jgi:hypothetical protein
MTDRIIRYTTASERYDGFGTETVEVTKFVDNRGREFRKVSILPENYDWQTLRYGSGLHVAYDEEQFNLERADGYYVKESAE